jgi:hypothetical protein
MTKTGYKKRPRHIFYKIGNIIDGLKFRMKIIPRGLVIVSGADSTHFKSLIQFIDTVNVYESHSHLVVFDLGLTEQESSYLKEIFPKIDYRIFDYNRYPSYFNIKVESGQYAWKPVIIWNILTEFKDSVVWFDAGCILTQPLFQIRKVLNKYGFYSPVASFSGSIRRWTHPRTVEFLNCDNSLLDERQLAGTVVGFKWNKSKVLELANKWKECALIKECIGPAGSTRNNHRHDQAILTILAYQHGLAQKIPQRFLGFKIHQDIDQAEVGLDEIYQKSHGTNA